ncbi:hypothetical protein DFA_07526 [Cavenderia fasciculata]|uniref:Ribosome biogenesis protein NOP53 n=1 Tax=Cavenderia fasciculata TaxID=261658 RepID=F4PWN8_CACFS|nr:uncharacterized protein DFA_07526 [Cavenderia fasciculata]EGG20402.1 hypothetical protein DFA_07526 [Cavenderia fasciculata]|eukprot:XP_004367385.1 hypothetical protein DFA_07526 [Cavenderia fasciculata]
MSLSPRTIELVKSTIPLIAGTGPALTTKFYRNLSIYLSFYLSIYLYKTERGQLMKVFPVEEKSDKQLFTISKTVKETPKLLNKREQKKELAKNKLTRAEKILSSNDNVEEISKNKNVTTNQMMNELAGKNKRKTQDLWEEEQEIDQNSYLHTNEEDVYHPRPTHNKLVKASKSVELPSAGMSYRPVPQEHQQTLYKALQIEKKAERYVKQVEQGLTIQEMPEKIVKKLKIDLQLEKERDIKLVQERDQLPVIKTKEANYGLSNSPSINNIHNISSQPVNTITTTTTTTNYHLQQQQQQQQPSPSFLPFNISSFNNIGNNNNNGNNTLPSPYLSSKYQQSNNGSTNNLYRLTSNQQHNNYETKDEIVHRLETQIQAILAEVELLKDRIKEMEEEQGRMKWGLKYSRRVLITSNFLLGINL